MQWHEFHTHVRHLTTRDQKRVEQAFRLGERVHKPFSRKSGEPYFIHPIAVAELLADMGADADTIIAALLHDTVEDTSLTLDEIGREFSSEVRSLIDGVTKLKYTDIENKPSLDEQTESIRKLFVAMEQDVRIMIIKLVDRLHNMQTVEFLSSERRKALAIETGNVYVRIADRLCMQDLRDELEGLCLTVLETDLYAQLLIDRMHNEQRGQAVIQRMSSDIAHIPNGSAPHFTIFFENKAWSQLKIHPETDTNVITGVSSVIAVFICDDIPACYQMLGTLHQIWPRETSSFQDFINAPLINGYRGLHTTVILSDGTRVRCKIRTEEMHEYARKGIATLCFQQKRSSVFDLIPWTKRISSLSSDTEGRSLNFWQSLQSDILGESIIVHGPGDETVQIPKGATALDGAFYLFQDLALNLQSVRINGQEARFSTPLKDTVTLSAEFADNQTVQRDWLQWVQTGFAAAKIRIALSDHSEEERIGIGREILQQLLFKKRGAFIEEFRETSVASRLAATGYASLNDTYMAIADGRLDPEEVFEMVFLNRNGPSGSGQAVTIHYTVDMNSVKTMDRINDVHRKFGASLEEIRYRRAAPSNRSSVILRLRLNTSMQEMLKEELLLAGATHVRIRPRHSLVRYGLGASILLFLWGADPVVAHLLLHTFSITAIDLTIVRFWSLTAMSGALFFWSSMGNPLMEERLSLKSTSLWVSVFLLLLISLTSYLSLGSTLPSHYTIPMTSAGLLLTSIVNRRRWHVLTITWSLLLLGILTLILFTPSWTASGIIMTVLAVAAFSAFSIVSERYKQQEHIGVRSAQYFFALSLLCGLLTLPLMPFSHLTAVPPHALILMVLFSIGLAGLPYYIYYHLLSHREIDFVLRYSFLIIFATVGTQALLIGGVTIPTLIAAGFVIVGAVLPLVHFQRFTKPAALQAPTGA